MKPTWDEIFIEYTNNVAKRSPDPKYQIGCVIVNEDNTRVLAFGYNGDEHGGTNERESLESGQSGFIHAEENALIKLDYSETYKKVYVTHSPCKMCCKKLINAKVNEIIYKTVHDQEALDWLSTHSIGKKIKISKYDEL
jgi:dCMP deaminase